MTTKPSLRELLQKFYYYNPDELGEDAFKPVGDDEINGILECIRQALPEKRRTYVLRTLNGKTYEHDTSTTGYSGGYNACLAEVNYILEAELKDEHD